MSRATPQLAGLLSGTIPGRVVCRVHHYMMPDGIVREKRWLTTTFQAPDGSIQTHEQIEVVPPLACGCVPEDMHDVALCRACRALVCASKHAFACRACGQSFCLDCRVRVEVEKQEVEFCPTCAREVMTPKVIRKLRDLIYGI